MKVNEMRKLDNAQIVSEIESLKKELFDLRFQHAIGQLEDTARIGKIKKAIARFKTILNERQAR